MDDLSASRISAGLAGTRFRSIEVVPTIDSTQTELVRRGGPDGSVLVADHQTAGRGRAGRTWTDLPGRMLMFSALLRGVPAPSAPLLALQAGLAVARALGPGAALKWPNDVRLGGRKVCGILGELAAAGDFVVVGIGVNVGHAEGELPPELGATSLRIEHGAVPRRDDLCVAILRELDRVLAEPGWLDDYRARCETIGRRVAVELLDGTLEGTATGVGDDGALIVDGRAVVAGDVVHVR